jgi:arylsulfatase A-like enzyme
MPRISIHLLTFIGFVVSAMVAQAADKRPNIVFIFSDDHAFQAISAYNHPLKLNQTPHIDRLAKEGMRFDNCCVTNSICGPSRAVILTGKYSHLNGFPDNSARASFDGSQQTVPKLLQAAGYETAVIGKWHLNSDPTGFNYWHILPGQGAYYNPPMIDNGKKVVHQGYTTDIIGDLSLDWLKNKRDPNKPFLLMCQHKAPHREWEPGPAHINDFKDRVMPEPDTLFDDYVNRGTAAKTQDMTIEKTMTPRDLKLVFPQNLTPEQKKIWDDAYGAENEAFAKTNLQGKDLVRWKYQRYIKDYLRCVQSVDDNVGRVLKYLDDNGLAENTIVMYSSDQGFFLGEHGWFDKRWIYEESVRTPLLVRWPGKTKPGSSTNDLSLNLDFGETFLDVAGVSIPGDMQGRSLVPVLKGETPSDWRKSFYYHYYEYPGPHSVRRHYGVRDQRYTLAYYYRIDEWELFDRKQDPKQLKNVYDDPAYADTVKQLKGELSRLRAELKVPEDTVPEQRPNPGGKNKQAAKK